MKQKSLVTFLFLLPAWLTCYSQASGTQASELEKDRLEWNRKLVHDTSYQFNKNPNAFLVQSVKGLKKGTALDIGMGQGRNSIFLAMEGWRVTGVDIADEAVHFAQEKAKVNHVTIDARISPMEQFDYGMNRWDLIVHVYEGCLDGDNHKFEKMTKSLKPGGLLVFEFFHLDAGAKMGRPGFGCNAANTKDIVENSKQYKVLLYSEEEAIADYSLKQHKVIKLLAKKK